MPEVNEYFGGKVKSINLVNTEGTFTLGVLDAGDYEFSTAQDEEMTVLSGVMQVKLAGDPGIRTFNSGQSFYVSANSSFKLSVTEQAGYLCRYNDKPA